MNLISALNYKTERIVTVRINVIREFQNFNIQDRIGASNLGENYGEAFSRPKIVKILEVVYTKEDTYIQDKAEIPINFEINKVYHVYIEHKKKNFRIFLNNQMVFDTNQIPYSYPGNLEQPITFQLSSIDKSITPIEILKSTLTEKERELVYNAGEMCENSMTHYLQKYKKRLILKFPDISELEPFDVNLTSMVNFSNE